MSKLSKLRAVMAERGVPALLLSQISSVQWATEFSGSAGWALITDSEAVFLTDSRYTRR